jgi:hypothetical protein
MRKLLLLIIVATLSVSHAQDLTSIQHMLDLDRFHAYTQSWALTKLKHHKEAAEAILKIRPSEVEAFHFSSVKLGDAFNYDELIELILKKKYPQIIISKSEIAWGYDFYKRKINQAYRIGKPSSVSGPAKAPIVEAGKSGGVLTPIQAAEAEDVLLNVDSYVANRTTRGVFWEASNSGRKVELHVGGAGDFKLNLAQRGANIIGEVKTEANNYNPIYLIQDPGEATFHYAVTEISGNDRLKHFQMQSSLVRWEQGGGRLAPPPSVEVVGDAVAKLANEEAHLTQVLKVVPKADHVLIGQKGAFERTIGSLGKIQTIIDLVEKHPAAIGQFTVEQQKLIQKALKGKDDLASFVMKNASPVDKLYDHIRPHLTSYNISEIPVHTVYNLDRGSYAVSDYLLKGRDGEVQRWRVFSNVWGDEVLPIAKALKNTGHTDILYMGTAGALSNSGLKVGDLVIPKKSHDVNGITREVTGRLSPAGAKSIDVVTHVSSPFEETNAWLADRNKFAQVVEVETGYLAKVFDGKNDKVSMMLLVSDVVGIEGETLAEASSAARRKAQISGLSTILNDAQVVRPVEVQEGDDFYRWISEIAPSRDPLSKFQVYKEAEFRKIATKEELISLMKSEKGFSTQRALTSLGEADTRMLQVINELVENGLRPDISLPREFLEGRWNPADGPISLNLRVSHQDSVKQIQQLLTKLKSVDKNFEKFLKISVATTPVGLDWIKLPGFLDNPEGTLFNLYQDSAIGFGGLAATETRTGNIKFVQVAPPQKGKAIENLAFFKPDSETEELLKQFSAGPKEVEKALNKQIGLINKGAFEEHYEVQLNKVDQLPEGALASITPELGENKLIIKLNITPGGLSNKAVALEEYVHLLQITANSDENQYLLKKFAAYSHPYQWAETVANAKAGSAVAMEQMAKLELDAVNMTNDVLVANPKLLGLKQDELQGYLAKRAAHAEAIYKDVSKIAKADMKRREAGWSQMKEIFNEMEKEPVKFNDLVAKNDRKGVRQMLEKYLPWDLMEPSEINSWKEWLEAIEHPDLSKAEVVFRGIDGDLLVKSADGNPGLLSTVLTKNQGSYTRRLRSLTTMREKIGVFTNYNDKGVAFTPVKSSLLQTMGAHAFEPKGSPFLSVSNDDVARAFGMQKRVALKVDPRRLVPNAMAWGFLKERERLIPLVIFPDEVIHLEEDPSYIDSDKFHANVEAKLGRSLTESEIMTTDDYSDFIKQGYDRVKRLMLDPEQLPKVQACTLESKSCDCVFKTLNALLK